MLPIAGILLSFGAMLCWGVGDFFIQKTARKVGDWEALFFISSIGFLIVLPFALPGLVDFWNNLNMQQVTVLSVACMAIIVAALFNFEALKSGKLSIVEPLQSLEIPVAGILAYLFLSEKLSSIQYIVVVALMCGLVLVSFKHKSFSKKMLLEKGVRVGVMSAVIMGAANFFIGWGARVSDALIVNLVTDAFMAAVTLLYIISIGKFSSLYSNFRENIAVIVSMAVTDKMAWVAFAFAMVLAPIAVAGAISESYILIAATLGIIFNKEKLHNHQVAGFILALCSAIYLAATVA